MKVKEAMHAGVTCVEPATALREVAAKMRKEDIGSIPVVENNQVIGIVTDRDIACRALSDGKDPREMTVREVMTSPIFYCTEDQDLEDALHLMEMKEVRRLPVLNREKHMVGILALGDISAKASRELSGEALCAVSAHHSS